MLGNYLSFNGIEFPNPLPSPMSSKVIENVSQSEAGTDLVILVRPSKMNWSFSFNLSKAKRDILFNLSKAESTSMVYMGVTYTVRVRDFSEKLVEGSEWMRNLDGLYEVSVNVTEY